MKNLEKPADNRPSAFIRPCAVKLSNKKGFSLIELVIALSMIAILVTIGGPSISSWKMQMEIKKDTRDILGALKTARIRAINTNVPMTFSIDDALKRYSVVDLNGNVALTGIYSQRTGLQSNTLGSSVQFNTRGIPTNSGRIVIENQQLNKTIAVYLTGVSKILM